MSSRPNIVVVVSDCVRAQNLPLYGYDKPTAPRLSERAARGLTYENAISAAEQTLTSTSALFTGTYPATHGLFVTGDRLDPSQVTLAEAMSAVGYETYCINCNNPYISDFTDLDRGFDHVIQAFPRARRLWHNLRKRQGLSRQDANGSTIGTDEAAAEPKPTALRVKMKAMAKRLRWSMTRVFDGGAKIAFAAARRALREAGDKPVFVYVHLMETHMYYHPPPRHARLFLPFARGRDPWAVNQNPITYLSGETPMDELDFAIVQGLYDGAIHYTDELFGRFYDWMNETGMLDRSHLVFTADHGECFGEHGLLGHGQCVYDTVVRVPLVLWGPAVAAAARGRRIQRVVQNVDLTLTMLRWADCDDHPILAQCEGVDLPLSNDEPRLREVAFSFSLEAFERQHIKTQQRLGLLHKASVGVRSDTHKLIWNATKPDELYDLSSDPAETKSLTGQAPGFEVNLRAGLDQVLHGFECARQTALERWQDGDADATDPVVEERLRDLGYIE